MFIILWSGLLTDQEPVCRVKAIGSMINSSILRISCVLDTVKVDGLTLELVKKYC